MVNQTLSGVVRKKKSPCRGEHKDGTVCGTLHVSLVPHLRRTVQRKALMIETVFTLWVILGAMTHLSHALQVYQL